MIRCKRCNKELTDPVSIQRGYGAVCFMIVEKQGVQLRMFEPNIVYVSKPPIDDELYAYCLNDNWSVIHSNIPFVVTHHSPTGWGWGYAGSGASDFALNCVQWLLTKINYDGDVSNNNFGKNYIFSECWKHYQAFKEQFVMVQKGKLFSVKTDIAIEWLQDRMSDE